ncbi:hypothetical protein BDM02DRAFT_3132656 [Thelephora ganbajun]|uniref:Uncharacterized protein n=1 Tax=Thelephora ganbajun TaxID=370292 RepID=A0ACB6Z0N6_THEGA|nr:hypothetical protein BDM02DRAFT_3132656 [Thelephora ganbajun]
MTLKNNQDLLNQCSPPQEEWQGSNRQLWVEYPTMASLVDAIISQEDNEFPHHQFASGCSFDDIVWQQAIGACKNMDHNHHGCDMGDEEKVLFDLVSLGIIDHQEFNEPHKWSSCSIRYLAVVADHLWALLEAERSRNDRVEQELNELKGQVTLLNTRLLAINRFSFDVNSKGTLPYLCYVKGER